VTTAYPSLYYLSTADDNSKFFLPLKQFEEEEAEAPLGATLSGRKRLFSKELRCMMYGFGDDQNPYTESVDLLEDLVIEFITEMVLKGTIL
jgi:hypothetical protein